MARAWIWTPAPWFFSLYLTPLVATEVQSCKFLRVKKIKIKNATDENLDWRRLESGKWRVPFRFIHLKSLEWLESSPTTYNGHFNRRWRRRRQQWRQWRRRRRRWRLVGSLKNRNAWNSFFFFKRKIFAIQILEVLAPRLLVDTTFGQLECFREN